MRLLVSSEIGSLKQVLVHRPGKELEQLTLHLGRMLFDDIPYLAGAQKEHDLFASTLAREGAQVRYLTDMAAQSLGDPEVRKRFIREFVQEGGPVARFHSQALEEMLGSIQDPKELVEKPCPASPTRRLACKTRIPWPNWPGRTPDSCWTPSPTCISPGIPSR